jgi:hypothetical protein
MLAVEPLEARCLPSAFLPVDGLPDSRTGWARAPGVGAAVTVFYRDLTGPAASAAARAVTSWNQQLRHAGVGARLVAVAAPGQAEVVVSRGGPGGTEGGATFFPFAFADGSFPDGHPYFRWHGRIRIRMAASIPWYYGAAGAPPGGQADFETAVLHELGHALGLDHNNARDDPANADGFDTMNAVLPTGVARRNLAAPDLAALQVLYGKAP